MKISKIIFLLVFLIWFYFSAQTIYGQLPLKIRESLIMSRISLSTKHLLLDGDFYRAMLVCQEKVPSGEIILFESYNKDIVAYTKEWYRAEYFIQKAPYWLYPRRVTRADEKNAKDANFRLIFDERNDGFKLYHKDELIYANF